MMGLAISAPHEQIPTKVLAKVGGSWLWATLGRGVGTCTLRAVGLQVSEMFVASY